MSRWFAVLAALSAASAAASSLPDWASRAIASDTEQWLPERDSVYLLDSARYRYLPPEGSARAAPADGAVHVEVHGVVRVHKEEARKEVYAVLPYDPGVTRILAADAWVVSPDGRKTKAYGRSDFIDVAAQYNSLIWDQRRILSFISEDKVQAGGCVAWSFEMEVTPTDGEIVCDFARAEPVLRASLEVEPRSGASLRHHSSDASIEASLASGSGSQSWFVERQQPPRRPLPFMFFANPRRIWVTCGPARTWEQVSSRVDGLFEPKIAAAGTEVAQRARELAAGATDRWERIRSVAGFVQGSVQYLEITTDRDEFAGYRPHAPAEVLRNRFGDCKDKATLMVAMLRALGEGATVALVNNAGPAEISEDWPSVYFNHAIVLIRADGTEPKGWPVLGGGAWVAFDPTDPVAPLGVLSEADEGKFCLPLSAAGAALQRLPVADTETNHLSMDIRATVDAAGGLAVKDVEDSFGLSGTNLYRPRRQGTAEAYRERLEAWISKGGKAYRNLKWADEWDPKAAHYHLSLDYDSPAYGKALPNGMLLVCPDIRPVDLKLEEWRSRTVGACVLAPDVIAKQVRIKIPAGYAVVELPQAFDSEGRTFASHVHYGVDGDTLVMTSSLERRAGVYDKAGYDELRAAYRAYFDAVRASAVLKKAPDKTQS